MFHDPADPDCPNCGKRETRCRCEVPPDGWPDEMPELNPRERGDDDGHEYADPRDALFD